MEFGTYRPSKIIIIIKVDQQCGNPNLISNQQSRETVVGTSASITEKAITSPDWTGGKVYYQSENV